MVFGAFANSAPIVRGDGKILVGLRDFSATRLNSNGSVDTTFAEHGVLRNQTGLPLILQDIVEQDDGRMLMAGAQLVQSGNSSNPFTAWYRPVLARYTGDGKPLWLVVSANLVSPKVYSGTLYTGTGPAFNSVSFDPTKVDGTPVGTATFTFADGNHATFAFSVNGVAQTRQITRELFAQSGTVCH